MQDYKPNSHKFKEEQAAKELEEKKIQKVTSGTVRTKKKGELAKLKDVFITEDVANVKSSVINDVIIPKVKEIISDTVRNSIDMLLWGETGRSKKTNGTYVSYRDYSSPERKNDRYAKPKMGFDYEDLIFETRPEVEAVREQMEEIISRYGWVSVADMYEMADITAPYTANKYGWKSIRTAEPIRVRDGYILKLPRPMPVED